MKIERKLTDGRRVIRFLSDGTRKENEAVAELVAHLNRLDPGCAEVNAIVNDNWQYRQDYVEIPRGPEL